MKYQIQLSQDVFRELEADFITFESGSMIAYRKEEMILALASGHWISVHQEEAAKAELRRIHG